MKAKNYRTYINCCPLPKKVHYYKQDSLRGVFIHLRLRANPRRYLDIESSVYCPRRPMSCIIIDIIDYQVHLNNSRNPDNL